MAAGRGELRRLDRDLVVHLREQHEHLSSDLQRLQLLFALGRFGSHVLRECIQVPQPVLARIRADVGRRLQRVSHAVQHVHGLTGIDSQNLRGRRLRAVQFALQLLGKGLLPGARQINQSLVRERRRPLRQRDRDGRLGGGIIT